MSNVFDAAPEPLIISRYPFAHVGIIDAKMSLFLGTRRSSSMLALKSRLKVDSLIQSS